MNREGPVNGEVPLCDRESSQEIPRCVSLPEWVPGEGIRWWICEGCGIESCSTWTRKSRRQLSQSLECRGALRPVKVEWLAWDKVRTNIHVETIVELKEILVGHIDRWRRMSQNKTLYRPATKDCLA